MHVRGFTKSSHGKGSSTGQLPRRDQKRSRIQKSLGVHRRLQLMPFTNSRNSRPARQEKLTRPNLLGLRPDGVLRASPRVYAHDGAPGRFKSTSQTDALRPSTRPASEVIFDVVSNHTCEAKRERADVCRQAELENKSITSCSGRSTSNYSGCANTDQRATTVVRR